jgi:hypothetical protein
MNMDVTESAANTFTTKSGATPVSIQMPNGSALVMELLRVFIQPSSMELIAATTTYISYALCRKAFTTMPVAHDPDVIVSDLAFTSTVGARTAESIGVITGTTSRMYDLTDGNGNGVLYAGATLHACMKGTSMVSAKAMSVKILYRMKLVNANELVGMLRD